MLVRSGGTTVFAILLAARAATAIAAAASCKHYASDFTAVPLAEWSGGI